MLWVYSSSHVLPSLLYSTTILDSATLSSAVTAIEKLLPTVVLLLGIMLVIPGGTSSNISSILGTLTSTASLGSPTFPAISVQNTL